jgi:Kdo2-lipid IVA lauroyltransferase/acyltransferase
MALRIILYPISLLPFWVLYIISDFLYWLLAKVFKYRWVVVLDNLSKAFPEKTSDEINSIAFKYYKNLCDSIVETIKLISISKKELNKRMVANWDVLNEAKHKGQVPQAYMSHQFNWEWGTVSCAYAVPYNFVGLYNKISSRAFNNLMLHLRGKSGATLIDMDDMLEQMSYYQQQPNTLWGFIADQNPSEPRRGVWANFFNRETAFFKGAELVARRYNNMVFFGTIVKVKRGYYTIELTKVYNQGRQTADGEITNAYVQFLEKSIRQQPENWVWSHRRWKHKKPS